MSDSNDIERDSRLSGLYREQAQEQPPAALDAAILAAAKREVNAGPRRVRAPFARSWAASLSLAAVVTLSVTLVIVIRERSADDALTLPARDARQAQATAAPDRAAEPAQLAQSAPQMAPHAAEHAPAPKVDLPRAQPATPASRRAEEPGPTGKLESAAGERPAAKTAVNAASAADGDASREVAVPSAAAPGQAAPVRGDRARPQRDSRDRPETGRFAEQPATAPAAPAAQQAASESKQAAALSAEPGAGANQRLSRTERMFAEPPLPPQKWLERIEELRREGRLTEADASLVEFKKRYPDYPLPKHLK